MDLITSTGLNALLAKIAAKFVKTANTTEAGTVSIDSAPTADSDNLVKSGGVKAALDAKQNTLTAGDNISIEDDVISANVPFMVAEKATQTPFILPSSARHTFHTCQTNALGIVLTQGANNPGYIHKLMFIARTNNLSVTLPSGSVAKATSFTVSSGKAVVMTYFYTGTHLVFDWSEQMNVPES